MYFSYVDIGLLDVKDNNYRYYYSSLYLGWRYNKAMRHAPSG